MFQELRFFCVISVACLGIWLSAAVAIAPLQADIIRPESELSRKCDVLLRAIVQKSGRYATIKHLADPSIKPELADPSYRKELIESIRRKLNQFFGTPLNRRPGLVDIAMIPLNFQESRKVLSFIEDLSESESAFLTQLLFDFLRFYREASISSSETLEPVPVDSDNSITQTLPSEGLWSVFEMLHLSGYDHELIDGLQLNRGEDFSRAEKRAMLFRHNAEWHLEHLGIRLGAWAKMDQAAGSRPANFLERRQSKWHIASIAAAASGIGIAATIYFIVINLH